MKNRVLLCVLDWGLGHATRSLAVLNELERQGFEVIIASSGAALTLLTLESPGHTFYELPGYGVSYSNRFSFELGMIAQSRKILDAVSREQAATREILRKERIDAIISDTRYGCFEEGTRSIFLSHHLQIMATGAWKLFSPMVNAWHRRMISKFHDVWVPDYPDQHLSGELSRLDFRSVKFIGPLTTMRRSQETTATEFDIIAVLSGPEPERTRFSELLFRQLKDSGKRFLLVEGKPGAAATAPPRINFLRREELAACIGKSAVVISRSGYTTIMDMAALGGRAIFVPTPGQTEQLYLARRMARLGIAGYHAQNNFNLARALEDSVHYTGFDAARDRTNDLLANALSNLTINGTLD
jgi:UDP:flavonoid glycosyltransferase YjiC (YdhE family)